MRFIRKPATVSDIPDNFAVACRSDNDIGFVKSSPHLVKQQWMQEISDTIVLSDVSTQQYTFQMLFFIVQTVSVLRFERCRL